MGKKQTAPGKRRKLKVSHIIILLLLIGAGAFTLYRLNLKKQIKARFEAIRAAGYPVTLYELDQWYAMPETKENSALIILDSFNYYQEPENNEFLPVIGRAELPARTESLSEETRTLVSKFLSDNQKSIELLHEAAKLEHGRYPTDLTLGMGTRIDYLDEIRRGAKMLQLEAIYSAENNKQDEAIQSIKSICGIARSLENEPVTVSQLIRIACQGLAVSTFERVINKTELTDEQLAKLSQLFIEAQNHEGMLKAFAGERCMLLSILRNPQAGYFNLNSKVIIYPIIILYKGMGLNDNDAVICLDLIGESMDALKLPPHQRQRAANDVDAKTHKISKVHILLRVMPALSRLITTDLRNIAELRTAQAAIAVQRYRLASDRIPETLKDLVPDYLESVPLDPFDGKELRYKKLETGYVIYSIGEDLSDDNGAEMPKDSKERRNSKWDVTFVVER